MSEYEDKTLKFLQNHTYNITLAANEPETGTNSQGGIFRKYKIVEGTYPCTKKGIDGKPEKDADGKEIAVEKSCDCFFASDKLHEKIQEVVIECVFVLGPTGFSRFKRCLVAIEQQDIQSIVKELKDSRWAKNQAPNRVQHLCDTLEEIK